MLDRHSVGLHTPTDVAASPTGSYCVYSILKRFVPLSQRYERCEVIKQLFKVCTSCKHSYTNDRKFARSGMLCHSLMFQLVELLYAFQEINKWNACNGII